MDLYKPMKEVQGVIGTMLKILTLKLLALTTMLLVFPSVTPSFAQEDDFFGSESEDWSDDVLDESPAVKAESAPPVQKNTTKTVQRTVAPPPPPPPPPPVRTKPAPVISAPVSSQSKFSFNPVIQPNENYKVGSVAKRAGPPLLLIARPVYAPYSDETKTKFISASAEAYFHFKLGALPGVAVVPIDKISNNVQYFRDFSRRISSSAYKEAAKKMGASYLLYSEYDPKGKKVKFATEVYSIADNKKIAGSVTEIELSKLEDGLFDFAIEAAGAIIGTVPTTIQEFLAAPVIGSKADVLGDAIVSVGDLSKANAEAAVPQFDKLSKEKSLYLGKFAASQIFAQAAEYDKAIQCIEQIQSAYASQYPALQIRLAQLYRMQGSYSEALSEVNKASSVPSLKVPAQVEKARILEAQGNLQQAKSVYESVLSEGGEDGEILFQLALVSIGLKNMNQVNQYLEKSAAAGRIFDRGDYFDLGLRYEAAGNATEQAITAYRTCLGLQQDNPETWQKLAELYIASGREAEAAICYINLFQIDNNAYKDYLFKAGTMFENGGYLENAKDAYELYLGRRNDNPEVKVRLAKIELNSGDCEKALRLVDDVDTTGKFGDDVKAINTQCNKKVRVVVATQTSDKSWKAVFFWRAASGLVTIGGAGAGYLMDLQVKKKYTTYKDYKIPITTLEQLVEVKRLHDDVENTKKLRNLCYAGAGVGGLSLALSVVIPIVLQ